MLLWSAVSDGLVDAVMLLLRVAVDTGETSVAKHRALLQACMAGLGQMKVLKGLSRLVRLMIVMWMCADSGACPGLHFDLRFTNFWCTGQRQGCSSDLPCFCP